MQARTCKDARWSVMTVEFHLGIIGLLPSMVDQSFNSMKLCRLWLVARTKERVDLYWNRLSAGGDPNAQQCGWLKDKLRIVLAGRYRRH
jgi:predicted 3-demethylubiquinone-9 3-methyltransferase (glyoxalase superfamily)